MEAQNLSRANCTHKTLTVSGSGTWLNNPTAVYMIHTPPPFPLILSSQGSFTFGSLPLAVEDGVLTKTLPFLYPQCQCLHQIAVQRLPSAEAFEGMCLLDTHILKQVECFLTFYMSKASSQGPESGMDKDEGGTAGKGVRGSKYLPLQQRQPASVPSVSPSPWFSMVQSSLMPP